MKLATAVCALWSCGAIVTPSAETCADPAAEALQTSALLQSHTLASISGGRAMEPSEHGAMAVATTHDFRRGVTEGDQPVVLVTVNLEYLDMFKNWLYFAKPFLRGRRLFVVAEDSRSEEPLKALVEKLRDEVKITLDARADDPTGDPALYGTKDYGALVDRRAQHILDLLQQDFSVLYADIDTVWLKDPFQAIEAAGMADLYLTIDHPNEANPYCTCFMYVHPTANSRLVLQTWHEKVQGQLSNQGVFNEQLRELQASTPISVKVLPSDQYPPGLWTRDDPKTYLNATVLHANYLTGLEAKTAFFQQRDLWKPHAIDL